MTSGVPIQNLPYKAIQNLESAWTSNTTITIQAGQVRDSTNIFDIVLSAPVIVNAAITGLNGIDTGTFAASKLYKLYAISDPVSGLPTGCMISLSNTPAMPLGYGVYKLIGYWCTDASTHFLLGYNSGSGARRKFMFDAPQATAVTAGNATSYTAVALTNLVPHVENTPVFLGYAFTPGAASRTFNVTPGNATGNAVTVTGQVTSVVVSGVAQVLSKVTTDVPEVDYKVSNSGDAVAINVAGYEYDV